MKKPNNVICVILAVLAFALITLALVMVFIAGPAAHYEISLYDAYPPYFWFSIIASLALGLLILVIQAFYSMKSRFWLAGLIIVMLGNAIIFSLPLFRGYYAVDNYGYGSTDDLSHIGFIRDIQLNGHFGSPGVRGENFYPALHILIFTIASIGNIDVNRLLLISPIFIYIFYLVGLYILVKKLTKDSEQILLAIAFASVPVYGSFHLVMKPMMYGIFILPLLLYLYFSKSLNHMISFNILLLSMPFYHPIAGGIALLIVFLCGLVSFYIYKHLFMKNKRCLYNISHELPEAVSSIFPSVILFITWFTWTSQFTTFRGAAVNMWGALEHILGVELTLLVGSHPIIPKLPITSWLIQTAKNLGSNALYFLLAIYFIILLMKRRKRESEQFQPYHLFFTTLFLVFSIILAFAERFLTSTFGFCRVLLYSLFSSVLINGISLGRLVKNAKKPKIVLSITVLVLFMALPTSVLTIHNSPWILRANPQVTHSEVQGMSWFLNHQDEQNFVDQTFFNQKAMAWALLGKQKTPPNLRDWLDALAPDHFKYFQCGNRSTYLLLNTLSYVFYELVLPQYPESWRWTPEDFKGLKDNSIINLVYSNGGFEVFYIYGVAK